MRWPVVYLLHGYSDSYDGWYKRTQGTDRSLEQMAARFRTIIVLPDGKYSSWYLDAAADVPDSADWQWETVITRRLVPEIDKRLRTWAEPAGRGIDGLSMGGHGAIYLCGRHPELFSVCGSLSGVMDLRRFKDKYRLVNLLGPYDANPQRWLEHTAIAQAEGFAGRQVGIILDCGLDDKSLIGGNREMHEKLIELKVPHDYLERPGGHTWSYWVNALPYHLQFMTDRLKKPGVPATEK
jgi:S-formylglutathione hydrolase FrmB